MSRPPRVIEIATRIDAPSHVVFDLELDAHVHADSLAISGESAVTSTGRRQLGLGDEVTFSARHFGVRWRMTAVVSEMDRPRRFVDEQVRGPFAALRHEHVFTTVSDGRTMMIDRMSVRMPGGPVGALVERLLVVPYLRRLLSIRAEHIKAAARSQMIVVTRFHLQDGGVYDCEHRDSSRTGDLQAWAAGTWFEIDDDETRTPVAARVVDNNPADPVARDFSLEVGGQIRDLLYLDGHKRP